MHVVKERWPMAIRERDVRTANARFDVRVDGGSTYEEALAAGQRAANSTGDLLCSR